MENRTRSILVSFKPRLESARINKRRSYGPSHPHRLYDSVFPAAAGPRRRQPITFRTADLHAKWFKAFDIGDGATMDQMEMDNLVLVMPNGDIWRKPGPRAGKQRK